MPTENQTEENQHGIPRWVIPILYLAVWFIFVWFCEKCLEFHLIEGDSFLIISFLVLVFGFIGSSTSWSIGHEKFGIKSDSRARIIFFHKNEKSWFDIYGDDTKRLEDEKFIEFVKSLIEKLD